jgi:putative glutamine amidotransferase
MRIAISQRADDIAGRDERRDSLDQRWAARLEALGIVAVPLPNGLADPAAWCRALGIEGLLLSGGNDLGDAPERDDSENLLLCIARAEAWPVLGVCRGLQLMNRHLGGRLVPIEQHVAVRHRLKRSAGTARLLGALPDGLEVNSFHGQGLPADGLAAELRSVLVDDGGFVEAAEHRQLSWAGVMWHPEREAAFGTADRALLSAVFGMP